MENQVQLLEGFSYPPQFLRLVELGIHNLEPWHLVEGDELLGLCESLKNLYPQRTLVPLYRRQDNDDMVCVDPNVSLTKVLRIHIGASSGWEERQMYKSVYDWFQVAVQDCIEFDGENYEW